MEELARKGEGLDRAQLDVLMAGIDYIAEYPDCVHHPLEDRVFERLLATQLSAEERTRVETNAAKHQELTAATMQLQSDLRAMLDGQTDALVNLDHDVLEFIDGQRRHITFEEQYVFPLAERQLTRSDWQEIEAQEAEERDPLFDQRLTRYDGLYRYISAER
jgi:hemerythrin-like domain-containing protein